MFNIKKIFGCKDKKSNDSCKKSNDSCKESCGCESSKKPEVKKTTK